MQALEVTRQLYGSPTLSPRRERSSSRCRGPRHPNSQLSHRRALTPADARTAAELTPVDANTKSSSRREAQSAAMADAPPQPPAPPSKEQQLSIEEQQIIAEIQELQRHLRELKAQEGHDDDEELVVPTTKTRTPRRVLVVANRLPIRARRDARTARWTFDTAPGGLATALRGIATDVEFVWVSVNFKRPSI